MDIKIKPKSFILLLTLFLSVLPVIHLAGFGMPVLYLLLPIGGLVFKFSLFGWLKAPKMVKILLILMLLITVEIFLSAFTGTVGNNNKFVFPTDVIQYIARFLCLLTFAVAAYHGKIEADTFIKYFLLVLNIGMLIGVLQWIPWPGRVFFIKLYPFRDGSLQLSQLNRSLANLRMHGLAQHATANGGLASFFFIFAFTVYKYYKKYRISAVILMILSIVNLFASMARAGMLALVAAIFFFYIIDMYISRKSLKPTLYMLIAIFLVFGLGWVLYMQGNPFIEMTVYRWNRLFDTKGGARVDQVKYFLSLFENTYHYLFGLSKYVVNNSAMSYGVEIEPPNIFVLYGGIGFILQYSLVLVLLVYFFKHSRVAENNKGTLTLLVASFIGLFSYQVFSVGYFFFREINVGLFPWILMGVAIGVYERYRLDVNNT